MPEDLVVDMLTNWLNWVVLISTASAAFVVVGLEWLATKLMRPSSTQLKEEAAADEFLPGAKVLVGQAFAVRMWLLKLWRWLEVLVAMVWFGFALLMMHWMLWLSLVALSYVVPAAMLYGVRTLLQAPALVIMTKGTAAQAIFTLCVLAVSSVLTCAIC